jgi:hypothetical protein
MAHVLPDGRDVYPPQIDPVDDDCDVRLDGEKSYHAVVAYNTVPLSLVAEEHIPP